MVGAVPSFTPIVVACFFSSFPVQVGLMRNLKSARWYSDVDVDVFFPRCYELNDAEEWNEFEGGLACVYECLVFLS